MTRLSLTSRSHPAAPPGAGLLRVFITWLLASLLPRVLPSPYGWFCLTFEHVVDTVTSDPALGMRTTLTAARGQIKEKAQ